ncbi:MAG: hypothetical protein ABFS43_05245, partial [Thermodesulfobacteriota bacterium]
KKISIKKKFLIQISDLRQSRPLRGAFLIPPALLEVADFKKLNARLEEYRDHLEEQVKARTRELTIACSSSLRMKCFQGKIL